MKIKPVPKIGRPVKAPEISCLPSRNKEAEKIFKQCAAPATWGEKEITAVWRVLMNQHYPGSLTDAVTLDKMWKDEPEVMLQVMPKFNRLATKIWSSAEQFTVRYVLDLFEIAEAYPKSAAVQKLNWFWEAKAGNIANELSKGMRGKMSFTGKHVSNARAKLNRLFPKRK